MPASMEPLPAQAIDTEIQQPLPAYPKDAQEQGVDDYLQSQRSIVAEAERLGNFLEDFLTPR